MAGQLPKDHRDHASCDPTFSRCVPASVHTKLANGLAPRHGGDREAAKAALLAWYPTIWSSLPPDFVMGDAFKFWQTTFDEAFASKAPGSHSARKEPKSNVPDADATRRKYLS